MRERSIVAWSQEEVQGKLWGDGPQSSHFVRITTSTPEVDVTVCHLCLPKENRKASLLRGFVLTPYPSCPLPPRLGP